MAGCFLFLLQACAAPRCAAGLWAQRVCARTHFCRVGDLCAHAASPFFHDLCLAILGRTENLTHWARPTELPCCAAAAARHAAARSFFVHLNEDS